MDDNKFFRHKGELHLKPIEKNRPVLRALALTLDRRIDPLGAQIIKDLETLSIPPMSNAIAYVQWLHNQFTAQAAANVRAINGDM